MAWASPTTVSTQPSGGSPQVIPSSSKRTGEHPSAKGKRLPSSGPPRKNPRPGQAGHSPQPGTFGHRYWRFNEETQRGDPGYPKPISVWQGIPASPKGAFLSNDAGTRASPCPACPAFTIPPPPHTWDRACLRSPASRWQARGTQLGQATIDTIYRGQIELE